MSASPLLGRRSRYRYRVVGRHDGRRVHHPKESTPPVWRCRAPTDRRTARHPGIARALLVQAPGGRRIDDPIDHELDIIPTIIDAAGVLVETRRHAEIRGHGGRVARVLDAGTAPARRDAVRDDVAVA